MQPTQKLYESDAFLQNFTATVLHCEPHGDGFAVLLDRTAFYPEGGGQPCDTGRLGPVQVTDVRREGEVILHITDGPLTPGESVEGQLDWARRLDHMEQHTGEHILSGTLHRLFGAENVGFHIGQPAVRMDIDRPLTTEQLEQAEAEANAVVRANRPVRCWYPPAEELASLPYRSKKALDEPVRLVDAGGADLCACCGTHLATTGQVGLIKILSAQNYKGGVRLSVAFGQRAISAVAQAWRDLNDTGTLLSAPAGGLAPAARRLLGAETALKQRLAALQNDLAAAWAQAALPGQVTVLHCDGVDGDGLRRLCMAVSEKTGALCAVMAPGGQGLAYAMAGPGDLRPLCRAMNTALGGRGGGKAGLCQGSLPAGSFAAAKEFLMKDGISQ